MGANIEEGGPKRQHSMPQAIASKKQKLADKFEMRISQEKGLAPTPADQNNLLLMPHQQPERQRTHSSSGNTKSKAPTSSIISELINILEVDKLIFKTFNTLIAKQMKQEIRPEGILHFLASQRQQVNPVEAQMPKSDIGRQNNEAIGCYFTFVRESLKFMIFSFFKRCRLIIKILIQYFENKDQASDHDGRHRRRSRQRETRESILADMLGQNLKWAFLTIHTCIERIE